MFVLVHPFVCVSLFNPNKTIKTDFNTFSIIGYIFSLQKLVKAEVLHVLKVPLTTLLRSIKIALQLCFFFIRNSIGIIYSLLHTFYLFICIAQLYILYKHVRNVFKEIPQIPPKRNMTVG